MISTPKKSMTRTMDDIYNYQRQALDLLSADHPHYDEIKQLLTQQIDDEIDDYAHTITD